MFEGLNVRTRDVVAGLASGQSVSLGGESVGPFSAEEGRMLSVLAENLDTLRGLTGGSLVDKISELLGQARESEVPSPGGRRGSAVEVPRQAESREAGTQWKIGRLRAYSFRGLAPAGKEWKHDFAGRSHLLYGPNGCGKSSLLGAICWCLTGRVFRDDQAPSPPKAVRVFPAGERTVPRTERPDALALMNASGQSTSAEDEYWVELELVAVDPSGGQKELWIRRHSAQGLSMSQDAERWESISTTEDAGLGELDAELRVVLPARASHIRFGKGSDLIHILSEVVGLDDLEDITGLAGSLCRALRTQATDIAKSQLAPEQAKVPGFLARIEEAAGAQVKRLPSYGALVGEKRQVKDVESFLKAAGQSVESKKQRLAMDLAVEIPQEGTPAYAEAREKLDDLPGQLRDAIDQLERPISELFPRSLGFPVPSGEEIDKLDCALQAFEKRARDTIGERLEWAAKEREDPKARLMWLAAKHFPEGAKECPVCSQDLGPVPEVRDSLEQLRTLSDRSYLAKELRDMERELIDELSQIVPEKARQEAEEPLCDRIVSDWAGLKKTRFGGFLDPIAEPFDAAMAGIAENTRDALEPAVRSLAEGHKGGLAEAFSEADEAVRGAQRYLGLCRSVSRHSAVLKTLLTAELLASAGSGEQASLRATLEAGRSTSQDISEFTRVRGAAQELLGNLKRQAELSGLISRCQTLADRCESTKALTGAVRAEVTGVVSGLEAEMRENFHRLYDDDVLGFDMLTMGHAANPNVRDEMNAYMLAGDERVPVGPFCNQGRMRAIVLSLIFALLQKSGRSLDVLVLDDPSMSLDDEHKDRFVNRLVEPFVGEGQVILATHYEKFYKDAEPVFQHSERLQMPPRRGAPDAVSFEPMDLLERVNATVAVSTCLWREMGLNLRRWVERTLATLSAYSPTPFVVFNNVTDTITAYAAITDPGLATAQRDSIVRALRSPEVNRVVNPIAHDEELTETQVRDALKVLNDCKEHVRNEIRRLKQIYHHELMRRAVAARPSLSVLPLRDTLGDWNLEVVGEAAAAHNGVGVCWAELCVASLSGAGAALATLDTISPVARIGQRLLLDPLERLPDDGDLVVVATEDGRKYLRRFFDEDCNVCLDAANPTVPYRPVILGAGNHCVRRVVGLLTEPVRRCPIGDVGAEWVEFCLTPTLLAGVRGLKVRGTCLEPVARDGQIVLVVPCDQPPVSAKGELLCIEQGEEGALIKRSHYDGSRWILQALNVNDPEIPIVVEAASVARVHKVVGVLFEAETRDQ